MTETSPIAPIAPISPDWRHLAKSFCKLGATDEQLAELFSVSPETIAGWMAEIPDFADAVRRGRQRADAGVANSLYQLAVGYSHTVERVLKGRDGPVTVSYLKHYPPHSQSCMKWLVNRRPDLWGRPAIKRKLQEWEEARDAAARRPPLLSPQALAALVVAREEASSVVRQPEQSPAPEQAPREAVEEPALIDAAAGSVDYDRVINKYRPAPRIGEDGGEVMREAGLSHAAIDRRRVDRAPMVPA